MHYILELLDFGNPAETQSFHRAADLDHHLENTPENDHPTLQYNLFVYTHPLAKTPVFKLERVSQTSVRKHLQTRMQTQGKNHDH